MDISRFKLVLYAFLMSIALPAVQVQAMFEASHFTDIQEQEAASSIAQTPALPQKTDSDSKRSTNRREELAAPAHTAQPDKTASTGFNWTNWPKKALQKITALPQSLGNMKKFGADKDTKEYLSWLVTFLTEKLNEVIQGSSDLITLDTLAIKIEKLIADIERFSSTPTQQPTSDADQKEQADNNSDHSKPTNFYHKSLKDEIEKCKSSIERE